MPRHSRIRAPALGRHGGHSGFVVSSGEHADGTRTKSHTRGWRAFLQRAGRDRRASPKEPSSGFFKAALELVPGTGEPVLQLGEDGARRAGGGVVDVRAPEIREIPKPQRPQLGREVGRRAGRGEHDLPCGGFSPLADSVELRLATLVAEEVRVCTQELELTKSGGQPGLRIVSSARLVDLSNTQRGLPGELSPIKIHMH